MCILCVELVKDKLTSLEARKNLGEMHEILDKDHIHNILKLIWRKEDDELLESWINDPEYGDTD